MDDEFLTKLREAPSREFDEALRARLSRIPDGGPGRSYGRRWAFALAALALLLAMVSSPSVRVLAQRVLAFFSAASANSFPLPHATLGAPSEPEPTASPLAACPAAPAEQRQSCELAHAEVELGFAVQTFSETLPGFAYESLFTQADPPLVRQIYSRPGAQLLLTQTTAATFDTVWDSDWGNVPAEAVEAVRVNGHPAEFVRGMFVSRDPAGVQAAWEPEAPLLRLRWQEGEFLFEIQLAGLPGDDEDLGVDRLIALAEALRDSPAAPSG